MTRKMKDSGIEWIGEIPESWEVTKIKSLCTVKDGTHDTPEYIDESENSFPLITSKNIKNGEIDFGGAKYISLNDYIEINKRSNVQQNDVIMPMIGTVGNPAIVRTGRKFSIKNVALFKCAHNSVLAKLIKYYLESEMITGQFEFLNRGGVQSFVSLVILQNLVCTMIPEPEQTNIVNYLDSKCAKIDETIEKQKQVIEKLKAYKQSVITEAVTKGLNPDVPMKDSGIEWIGNAPEHWKIKRIKYLLFEINDKSESGSEEPLSMSQIYGIIKSSELDIPNPTTSYEGNKKVYVSDLVFNKLKAHLGVFSVSKYYGIVSPDYSVYRGYDNTDTKYLEYLFKTPQCISEFKKYIKGVGAGLSRLYTSELFNIKVAMPTLDEQKNIADYLDQKCSAIDATIAKKEILIQKLTDYKKSLIYECVTGKREV